MPDAAASAAGKLANGIISQDEYNQIVKVLRRASTELAVTVVDERIEQRKGPLEASPSQPSPRLPVSPPSSQPTVSPKSSPKATGGTSWVQPHSKRPGNAVATKSAGQEMSFAEMKASLLTSAVSPSPRLPTTLPMSVTVANPELEPAESTAAGPESDACGDSAPMVPEPAADSPADPAAEAAPAPLPEPAAAAAAAADPEAYAKTAHVAGKGRLVAAADTVAAQVAVDVRMAAAGEAASLQRQAAGIRLAEVRVAPRVAASANASAEEAPRVAANATAVTGTGEAGKTQRPEIVVADAAAVAGTGEPSDDAAAASRAIRQGQGHRRLLSGVGDEDLARLADVRKLFHTATATAGTEQIMAPNRTSAPVVLSSKPVPASAASPRTASWGPSPPTPNAAAAVDADGARDDDDDDDAKCVCDSDRADGGVEATKRAQRLAKLEQKASLGQPDVSLVSSEAATAPMVAAAVGPSGAPVQTERRRTGVGMGVMDRIRVQ